LEKKSQSAISQPASGQISARFQPDFSIAGAERSLRVESLRVAMPLASANVQENKSQPAQKPVPQQKDTPTAKQMIKQNTKQGAANAPALNVLRRDVAKIDQDLDTLKLAERRAPAAGGNQPGEWKAMQGCRDYPVELTALHFDDNQEAKALGATYNGNKKWYVRTGQTDTKSQRCRLRETSEEDSAEPSQLRREKRMSEPAL